MAEPVKVRVQLSREDLRRIESELDKLGQDGIAVKLPKGLGNEAKYAAGSVGDLKQRMKQLNDEIDDLSDSNAIREKQQEVKKLNSEMDELLGKTKKVNSADGGAGAGAMGGKLKGAATGFLVGGGAAALAGHVFDKWLDLDVAKKDLEAITMIHGAALDQLVASAEQSSSKYGTSWTANLDAMKIAISKLSPEIAENKDAMASITDSINIFAKASKTDASASATILSDSLNALGYGAADASTKAEMMARLMNVLAAASAVGAIESDQVSESLLKVGSTFKATNVSMEEGIATIEVLGEVLSQGSENGTALKGVMLGLERGRFIPEGTRKELEAAGVDINKLSDKSLSLADRLELLKPIVNDTALLTAYFGEANLVAAQQVINNTDKIREYTKGVTDTKSATEQANIQMDSARQKFGRFTTFLENQGVKALDEMANMIGRAFGGLEQLFDGDILGGLQDLLDPAAARLKEMHKATQEAAKEAKVARAEYAGIAESAGAAADAVAYFDKATGKWQKPAETIGQLKQRLSEAQGALDSFSKTDTKGIAKQQALIGSLERELARLTGGKKAQSAAGSIERLNEQIAKYSENMRKVAATSDAYFRNKRLKEGLESDLELITSGVAEKWGNDLEKMKKEIISRAEKISPEVAVVVRDAMTKGIKQLKEVDSPVAYTADIWQEIIIPADAELKLKERLQKLKDEQKKARAEMVQSYTDTGVEIGEALGSGIVKGLPGLKEAFKSILIMILDYMQRAIIAANVANAIKNFATLGPLGLVKAAGEAVLLSTMFGAAKAAITGFEKGGVVVGESGPEIIAPYRDFSDMAGALIAQATAIMRRAVTQMMDAQYAAQSLRVDTRVSADAIELRLRGRDFAAALKLAEKRDARGSLGVSS